MSRLTQQTNNKKFITSDDIFNSTDGGLDIFKNEIDDFTLRKNIRNPFITGDKNPSARIKQSKTSDLWILYIYNDEGGFYNAIQFIEKKYGLDYKGAINYIAKGITLNPVVKKVKRKIIKPTELFYEINSKDYTEQHKNYLCIREVTEKFLVDVMDIYAVEKYAINKKVLYPKEDEYMFCYKFVNENGDLVPGKLKLLTLGSDVHKKDKWRNNLNPFDFFYTYKIEYSHSKYIFVTKSNKDCIPLELAGISAIASMSENQSNIITGLKILIEKYPDKEFIINMGTDEQGKATSIEITKELNLQWFNTPNRSLINDINDNWEYYKFFGLESFKKLLQNKNYI